MPTKTSSRSKTAASSGNLLNSKRQFNSVKAGLIAGTLVLVGIVVVVFSRASSASPVPCNSVGNGNYSCGFYTSTPVRTSANREITTLAPGNHVVKCQASGAQVSVGRYYNSWWAYTQTPKSGWGWANAVYGRGGDNNGRFRGVPICNQAIHYDGKSAPGYPPAASAARVSASCSIVAPTRAAEGAVVTPTLTVTNTGTTSVTPHIQVTLATLSSEGRVTSSSYSAPTNQLTPGSHKTVSLSSRTVAWAKNSRYDWSAKTSSPSSSCAAQVYKK